MLGVDWGAMWDWLSQPAVAVATAVVIALIGGAYKIGTRRSDRLERDEEKKAAAETARQRAEDQLDETPVSFGRWACVPFGSGTSRPQKAPLTIEVYTRACGSTPCMCAGAIARTPRVSGAWKNPVLVVRPIGLNRDGPRVEQVKTAVGNSGRVCP